MTWCDLDKFLIELARINKIFGDAFIASGKREGYLRAVWEVVISRFEFGEKVKWCFFVLYDAKVVEGVIDLVGLQANGFEGSAFCVLALAVELIVVR